MFLIEIVIGILALAIGLVLSLFIMLILSWIFEDPLEALLGIIAIILFLTLAHLIGSWITTYSMVLN